MFAIYKSFTNSNEMGGIYSLLDWWGLFLFIELWGQVLDSTNKVQQDELHRYEQYEGTMPRKQHSVYLQRLGLARERCRAQDSEDRLRPAEQSRPHPVHQRQRDEVHLQRGGREAARHLPDGGPEHLRGHRQRQGACPGGDTEHGLHGLPPRGQPHAEERAH